MAIKMEDIELEDIQDFLANGVPDNAPPEIINFLQLLDKIRGMQLRFDKYSGRDAVINHLVNVDGYSRYLAGKYYDMAMEYFYADRQISKKAWRNIIAEKMDKAINLALAMAENTRDVTTTIKSLKDLYDVLALDESDKDEIPQELLQKPWKIYSADAEFLGLPKANRYELARQIDELPEISEKEKQQIKREAQVLDIKIFQDDNENPRS